MKLVFDLMEKDVSVLKAVKMQSIGKAKKPKIMVAVVKPIPPSSQEASLSTAGWLHDLERDETIIRDLISKHRPEEKDGVKNIRQLVSMNEVETLIFSKNAEIYRIQSLLDRSNATISDVYSDINLLKEMF